MAQTGTDRPGGVCGQTCCQAPSPPHGIGQAFGHPDLHLGMAQPSGRRVEQEQAQEVVRQGEAEGAGVSLCGEQFLQSGHGPFPTRVRLGRVHRPVSPGQDGAAGQEGGAAISPRR